MTIPMLASLITASLFAVASGQGRPGMAPQFIYETVPYIFQNSPPNDMNMGLLARVFPTDPYMANVNQATLWQRLDFYISVLNRECQSNERYVLLYLGRDEESYAHAAQENYGTGPWVCYWGAQSGNGTVSWEDAHLTDAGIQQALSKNRVWKHLLEVEKATPPQRYYTSPMYRALQTANLTFSGLNLPVRSPFVPTVKELLRDIITASPLQHRRNRGDIHAHFPRYQFERRFQEDDPFWMPDRKERDAAVLEWRMRAFLDDLFANDESRYISITSHYPDISAMLQIFGHKPETLDFGESMQVIVKVTTLPTLGRKKAYTTKQKQKFAAQTVCLSPPQPGYLNRADCYGCGQCGWCGSAYGPDGTVG